MVTNDRILTLDLSDFASSFLVKLATAFGLNS
jgi:hypothetical protein